MHLTSLVCFKSQEKKSYYLNICHTTIIQPNGNCKQIMHFPKHPEDGHRDPNSQFSHIPFKAFWLIWFSHTVFRTYIHPRQL